MREAYVTASASVSADLLCRIAVGDSVETLDASNFVLIPICRVLPSKVEDLSDAYSTGGDGEIPALREVARILAMTILIKKNEWVRIAPIENRSVPLALCDIARGGQAGDKFDRLTRNDHTRQKQIEGNAIDIHTRHPSET